MPSRASKAMLMVDSRADRDIGISSWEGRICNGLRGFFGIWRDGVKAYSPVVLRAPPSSRTSAAKRSADPGPITTGSSLANTRSYRSRATTTSCGYGSRVCAYACPGRQLLFGRQPGQKPRQIIRDAIDIGRVPALQFPVLAHHFLGAIWHHQHRGHAELVRDGEVAGEVLEHGGFGRIDRMVCEKLLIGLRRGLRLESGGDDVEHAVEMRGQAESRQHGVDMVDRAVGEDQLASRQLCDGCAERRVRLQRRVVDLVDVSEVV